MARPNTSGSVFITVIRLAPTREPTRMANSQWPPPTSSNRQPGWARDMKFSATASKERSAGIIEHRPQPARWEAQI